MRHASARLGWGPLLTLLWFASSAAPGWAHQPEAQVSCVEGSEPHLVPERAHTSGCAIDTMGDEDFFEIQVEAGDFVLVLVESENLNLDVEIRDPEGTLLWDAGCQSTQSGDCFHSAQILGAETTGLHDVRISDPESDGTGSYTLGFEVVPAEVPEIAIIREFFTDISSLERRIDQDTYVVEAVAGERIRVSLEGLGSEIVPRLRHFDFMAAGDPRVSENLCGFSCVLDYQFVPENAGLHYFVVSDVLHSGVGDFQITVEFLPEARTSLPALIALCGLGLLQRIRARSCRRVAARDASIEHRSTSPELAWRT